MGERLDFEISKELQPHAGIASMMEAVRLTGTAGMIGRDVTVKHRTRGLMPPLMARRGGNESISTTWPTPALT